VESGLAEAIARDLTADCNSSVAPLLQVLVSRLWQVATGADRSRPRLTMALYARLRDEGFQLTDFLDRQLRVLTERAAAAGGTRAQVVTSGLALDVLAFHMSA
jgi:hypothetical protein